ncbi:hypothetical protein HMN09_01321200 [Mycena chlorophos]|uniref:Uncharacterized protein n=1 Tax=Mycena chlorophos TaxID=658473 RepID=A0A8H6VPR9_MYCCL|nr:hypothetical protein HMN09_01321200 [Mycena chlorophos]
MPLVFAYYCSGHGYGHATRVSALASHLLRLEEDSRPTIHIVSSAPKHVFADSIAVGAKYRNANIDPVIVQPLAYRVDRERSVATLRAFLHGKDRIMEAETRWLREIGANCVLSDAAFVGCLAANQVGIPSILVTNFTFDSVYSYLATSIVDTPTEESHESHHDFHALVPDVPVPLEVLQPLGNTLLAPPFTVLTILAVHQIYSGYRCADLLLRLPGSIPIPSFFPEPRLPSPDWVDPTTNRFRPDVMTSLERTVLLPSIPYPTHVHHLKPPREVIPVPLLVRPTSCESFSPPGRAKFLEAIGVPASRFDPTKTKVLVVSFGGQIFRRPGSATPTPSHSRRTSRDLSAHPSGPGVNEQLVAHLSSKLDLEATHSRLGHLRVPESLSEASTQGIATPSHLWIPGAPPASKPPTSPVSPRASGSTLQSFPITTTGASDTDSVSVYVDCQDVDDESAADDLEDVVRLLPGANWVAIVCGVSKEQWNAENEELPDGFYVAPRDVYMPDLTAVGDVLLGKLGYGTVSECIATQTPFVYVSRPLFIEEHGLRRWLESDGVGVELARDKYEAGDWAGAIEEAYTSGRAAKERMRAQGGRKGDDGGTELARMVVDWAAKWRSA